MNILAQSRDGVSAACLTDIKIFWKKSPGKGWRFCNRNLGDYYEIPLGHVDRNSVVLEKTWSKI